MASKIINNILGGILVTHFFVCDKCESSVILHAFVEQGALATTKNQVGRNWEGCK